jgi:hypothetical protein
MAEPIVLVRRDKAVDAKHVLFFCCGVCGAFCGVDEEYATYHCGGRPCESCGELCERSYNKCDACRGKERLRKAEERIAKAEKVDAEGYDGPVYWDEEDAFYSDLGGAWEAIEDEFVSNVEMARRQTLWACDKEYLRLFPTEILDNALESQEHYDGARDALSQKAWKALEIFCASWNDAHGCEIESWFPTGRLLVIPEKWWQRYEEQLEEQLSDNSKNNSVRCQNANSDHSDD